MFNTNVSTHVNAVSGNIVKTYKESYFKRLYLNSEYADRVLSGDTDCIVIQMIICGDMEVIAEIINRKLYDNLFKEEAEEESEEKMTTLLNERKVITRKIHRCQGCGTLIKIGEETFTQSCCDAGDAWTFYFCPICETYLKEQCHLCKDFGYCIGENFMVGELRDCAEEKARKGK